MNHMALIYTDPTQSPPTGGKMNDACFALSRRMKEAGVMPGGGALHPASTATSVRLRGGKVETMDGRFAVPGPEDLPDRLNSVLTVVYLIFTAGCAQGPRTGIDLCAEAIFLARRLVRLVPDQAEVERLLPITQARARARVSPEGATLPPRDQDRSLWDRAMLSVGQGLLDRAIARRGPGPFQIKAAIASLHSGTVRRRLPSGPPGGTGIKKGRASARPSPTGRYEGTRARSPSLRAFM